MQYTRLGKSDLLVSRICMGCMGFGDPSTGQHRWTLDETASRDIIRHALEQGINFYDTAIAYQNGSSERYVGRALREMAKREEVVLATKFLPRTAAQIAEGISGKQAIARSLDQSLRNLGMDYVQAQRRLAAGGIPQVKLIGANRVALRANAKQFALNGVDMVRRV